VSTRRKLLFSLPVVLLLALVLVGTAFGVFQGSPIGGGGASGPVEGTAVRSTGESGGTKFLREDGDNTSSWQTPAGGGDVEAVLDCASGDCDDLVDAPTAFASTDDTPDVSAGLVFITANASATTITDFDTELTNGKIIFVIVNDGNTTFDFTGEGLEGMGNDYLADTGDLLVFVYTTTDDQWHGAMFPKEISSITIGGFTTDRPVYSDSSGDLTAGDDGGHLEITGDDLEIKAGIVDSELGTGAAVADTAFTDLTAGDTYTNFGDSGDDTIDELFDAIDNDWPSGSSTLDIDGTPGSSGTYVGVVISGVNAGETITAGDIVYMDGTSNEWMLTDANVAGEFPAIGMAAEGGTDTNPMDVLVHGVARLDSWSWTDEGVPLYLSETPGEMTETPPSDDGDCVQIVATVLAITNDTILFRADTSWFLDDGT